MGIPQALRTETVPEDTGTGFKYTERRRNRQGGAASGRTTRSTVGRSAFTGHEPVAQPGGIADQEAAMQAETDPRAAFALDERFGRTGTNTFAPGDAQQGFGEIGEIDPAIDQGFVSPGLESSVIGDIGMPAVESAGFGAVNTFAAATAAEDLYQAAGYNVNPLELAVKSVPQTLAHPTTTVSAFGRGMVSTGHLSNVNAELEAAYEANPEAWESREEFEAWVQENQVAENMYNIEKEKGLWSGMTGLYHAAEDAWSTTGRLSHQGVSRAQQQSEANFDRNRAKTAAKIDPEFRGPNAEDDAFRSYQEAREVQRSANMSPYGRAGEAERTGYGTEGTDADATDSQSSGSHGSSTGSDPSATGEATGQHDSSDNDAGWY